MGACGARSRSADGGVREPSGRLNQPCSGISPAGLMPLTAPSSAALLC
jgi:hypothetical protein